MKLNLFKAVFIISCCIISISTNAQNNIDNLITSSNWDSLFPKRAGIQTGHPQGYATDFYSYNNFKQAINEMADYLVQIRKKDGVWGELITIIKKSTNTTYTYSDVDPYWHSNPTQETVINVDFEDFANTSSNHNNKRELAAFLANISKETTGGWHPIGSGQPGDYANWGLYFVHEVGLTTNSCNPNVYNDTTNTEYPATAGQCYYGRGPIQLSWNYNYGQFSKFLYKDASVLLNNPNLIQQDGVLAFKSAIWFWMMPQCPKPSCHQVMQEFWESQPNGYNQNKMYKKGFAHTNNIINGGLECRTYSSSAFTNKVVLRSELYKYYLAIMGFNSSEIAQEDSGDYSTLCYESTSNAMENYINCQSFTLSTQNLKSSNFSIYPNPTHSTTTISYNQIIQKVEVYTITGKKIIEKNPNKQTAIINMNSLNKGIYIAVITSEKKHVTMKLIKQ